MDNLFQPVDIQTNDATDPYEALVGEGKKFADAKALAKAKLEADSFIEQLKREADEMRKEVSSKATIDEIMTQIRALSPRPPQVEQPQTPPNANTATPEELETVVAKLLEKRTIEDRVKSNRQLVEEKLAEKWGADAQVNLNRKAKELGVTLESLQKMALETPTVLFAALGLNGPTTQVAPPVAPRSTQRVPEAPDVINGRRTKAFYQAMKQRNPTEYFSAKVRQQEMKDALALGESFFDA